MRYALIFGFILSAFSLSAQVNLDSGLVAYYPFNGNFMDMTAYGNDAISPAPPSFGEGVTGGMNEGCYFNGTTQHLEIPHASQISFANEEEFAISLWIKVPVQQIDIDGTVNDIISKWFSDDEEPYPFALRLYNETHSLDGKLWIGRYETNLGTCGDHAEGVSKKVVNDGSWQHVVLQKKNNQLVLHVGSFLQVTVEDITTCSVQNTSNIILGRRTTNPVIAATRRYHGAMDELRIYNRSLSSAEIILLGEEQSSTTHHSALTEWSIFPNPIMTGTELALTVPAGVNIESMKLFTLHGRFIKQVQSNSPFPYVVPGVYLLKITAQEQQHVLPIIVHQ